MKRDQCGALKCDMIILTIDFAQWPSGVTIKIYREMTFLRGQDSENIVIREQARFSNWSLHEHVTFVSLFHLMQKLTKGWLLKANAAFGRLRNKVWGREGITLDTKLKVYQDSRHRNANLTMAVKPGPSTNVMLDSKSIPSQLCEKDSSDQMVRQDLRCRSIVMIISYMLGWTRRRD